MSNGDAEGFGFADDARRYRLDSRIATGGMGEVWRGTDTVLSRAVAIKLLKHEYADDASFRSRFETEARHAGSLHHPGIAAVFDFGEGTSSDGSGSPRPYLVMELVDGQPLSDLLRPGEPMDPEVARDLLAQAAAAVGAAHAAGIVHRDIKPANLLVTPNREVKITDFGIARAAEGMALTQTGQVMGTPQYISPEQARGTTAVPASDVYALGVVAFECLAGRRPFVADTPIATALAHLREPVPPLPPEVPADLAAVVRKAMAKEPGERYVDGAAFAAALRDPATAATALVMPTGGMATDTGSTQVMSGAAAAAGLGAADTSTTGPVDGPSHAGPPKRRRGALWLLLGGVAVLALVVIGFLVFANQGDQANPTDNPTKHPSRTHKPHSPSPTQAAPTTAAPPTRSASPTTTPSSSPTTTPSSTPTTASPSATSTSPSAPVTSSSSAPAQTTTTTAPASQAPPTGPTTSPSAAGPAPASRAPAPGNDGRSAR